MTRHRENVHLYAARETVKDLAAIAKGLSAPTTSAPPWPTPSTRANGAHRPSRRELHADAPSDRRQGREPQAAGRGDPPTPSPTLKLRGTGGFGGQEAEAREDAADRALFGSAKAFGSAARALAVIFKAFMGEAAPPPMTAKERHAARLAAFRDAENQQRAANLQEKARRLGASDALTPEELKREQEAQEKRSRDRGGGNLSSLVDEGSSSTRQEPDRAAHNQHGSNGNDKAGGELNAPQVSSDATRARRSAMLQRFRRAARFMLRPVTSFRKQRGGRHSGSTAKAKGKATRAFWLDRDEQRALRRVAFLRRILGVNPKQATPAPVRTPCARQRSPPRPDHR